MWSIRRDTRMMSGDTTRCKLDPDKCNIVNVIFFQDEHADVFDSWGDKSPFHSRVVGIYSDDRDCVADNDRES